jgi:UDP-N-acetylmuramoyl-tripeptide--D-alanyl-D-alanine ligase
MTFTLAQLAAATGGELHGPDASFDRVVSDSRDAAGALLVAIGGERVDGHDFVAGAGAAGALASRPVTQPYVLVPDTVVALGAFAAWHRDRLSAHVVGVTGSAGKTSTKDLLAAVLAEGGPVIAPPGSLNTDIGAPLTVLRAAADTAFLVLEMGARHIGDVARLCAMARPQTAVVLNVGSAHLGEFGSREAIAVAKGELVEGATGLAVLNADDALVAAMSARAPGRVRTFGHAGEVRAEGLVLDRGRPAFRLVAPEGSTPVRMLLVGEHHVGNALAAATVALDAGLPVEVVGAALNRAVLASRWRMEVTERADGVTVVNDAYNANPESMRAAIDAAVAVAGGKRVWAVLGPMYELGEDAEADHAAVAAYARAAGARVVAVAAPAYAADIEVPDIAAAADLLAAAVASGDVVLVKASRAAGLERLAAALLRQDARVTPDVRA